MEATEQQINNLDTRMKELEHKIDTLTNVMGEINDELKKIARGLYGDEANATIGLIARQLKDEERLKDLELKVEILQEQYEEKIQKIQTNFKESDIKKKTTNELLDKIKKWAVIIGVIFLIAKEFIGLDSLGKLLQLFTK